MVGVFQLLGVSFFFWTCVGCTRFIFEQVHSLRVYSERAPTFVMLLAASYGVAAIVVPSFILMRLFGIAEAVAANSSGALILLVWLPCVTLGSYMAARISTREPLTASLAVMFGSLAAAAMFLQYAPPELTFSPANVFFLIVSVGATIGLGVVGGVTARTTNRAEKERAVSEKATAHAASIEPHDVAVLIAAHNEELSIGATIEALLKSVGPERIYIGSDGSKDRTVEVARSYGVHVDDIQPNRGKAGALTYVVEENQLLSRYKGIFLLDADIQADSLFLERALRHFDDPDVAAVSGYFVAIWPSHYLPRWELLVSAYRIRLWRILQFFIRYGQTWKYLNVSPIIPGGGSVYRASVLKHITINTPGLVIEDFNMTFEVRHKNLGLVAFEPRAYLYDQEPYSVDDFIKQIKRWYLGYFQTMRRHGVWRSWFCFFTYLFTLELIVSSFFFLLVPFMMVELLASQREFLLVDFGVGGYQVTLLNIAIAIFVIDYCVTVGVAIVERKPLLLLYGVLFFPLRYIESAVFLWMLPQAFFTKSTGTWISPKRVMFKDGA